MNFRRKIEIALEPLVKQLKARLASLPTLAVLDWYQFKIDLAGPDKSKVPDGFHYKWRYLWALLLSNTFSDSKCEMKSEVKRIDELIEKILKLTRSEPCMNLGGPKALKRSFSQG